MWNRLNSGTDYNSDKIKSFMIKSKEIYDGSFILSFCVPQSRIPSFGESLLRCPAWQRIRTPIYKSTAIAFRFSLLSAPRSFSSTQGVGEIHTLLQSRETTQEIEEKDRREREKKTEYFFFFFHVFSSISSSTFTFPKRHLQKRVFPFLSLPSSYLFFFSPPTPDGFLVFFFLSLSLCSSLK